MFLCSCVCCLSTLGACVCVLWFTVLHQVTRVEDPSKYGVVVSDESGTTACCPSSFVCCRGGVVTSACLAPPGDAAMAFVYCLVVQVASSALWRSPRSLWATASTRACISSTLAFLTVSRCVFPHTSICVRVCKLHGSKAHHPPSSCAPLPSSARSSLPWPTPNNSTP